VAATDSLYGWLAIIIDNCMRGIEQCLDNANSGHNPHIYCIEGMAESLRL